MHVWMFVFKFMIHVTISNCLKLRIVALGLGKKGKSSRIKSLFLKILIHSIQSIDYIYHITL